jgi:glycosyltransferase involved in cell wall biosynthesis
MNTQRLRVLQLGSPTGLYGAERWILALVKHLPSTEIESIVGAIKDAPGGEPPLCEQAAAMGLRTAVFEAHGKLSLPAVGLLKKFIREQRIDILHTHGYKTDVLGKPAVLGTGCRVISTPHGWSTNAGPMLRIYEALDRLSFYFLDAVVPLSSDLHDGLRKLPGLSSRLHLIGNGVDLSEVDAVNGLAPEVREWRAAGATVVGYIGQLIPRKGVDTLIRAFSQLKIPDRRLCIVGEGPQRAELEALAKELGETERVRFLGYRPDRIALLKGFHAFALPSALEGTPRCLLEAMAANVPIAATNIPGCDTLIRPGETGELFEVGDSAGLLTALSRLLEQPQYAASVAAAAQRFVRAEFSAETMAARYAALYRQVLAGRRAAVGSPPLQDSP